MERNTAKRTLEKLLSVCICLCMLGAMLPAQVFAEEADTAQTETVQDTAPKDTVYLSSADDLIQHIDGEHIGRRTVDDPALQRELTEEQQQQNSGKNNKDRTIPRKSAVDDTLMQGQRSVGAKDERRGSCNSEEQPLFGTMPGVIARQIASQQIDHHKMCKSLAGILHHIVGCERWNQAEDEQQ